MARIGILVPPGNPTVEPEMTAMTPPGVTLHFTRMHASGVTGSLSGQEARNREQIAGLDANIALLAMVKPAVIGLAHTATSYTLGRSDEAALLARLNATHQVPVVTAFGSVLAALAHLGVTRIAFGTPYSLDTTLQGKALLESCGLTVTAFGRLEGVTNIYDETLERAAILARQVDHVDAQAVFLSGVGMPTVGVIAALETELGKPVLSAASALMWNLLRHAEARGAAGFGRLFA